MDNNLGLIFFYERNFQEANRVNDLLRQFGLNFQVRSDIVFGNSFWIVLQDIINVNYILFKGIFLDTLKKEILDSQYPTLRGSYPDRLQGCVWAYAYKRLSRDLDERCLAARFLDCKIKILFPNGNLSEYGDENCRFSIIMFVEKGKYYHLISSKTYKVTSEEISRYHDEKLEELKTYFATGFGERVSINMFLSCFHFKVI